MFYIFDITITLINSNIEITINAYVLLYQNKLSNLNKNKNLDFKYL